MRRLALASLLAAAALPLLPATPAHAQWVFLARKALGRVEQLSQTQSQPQGTAPVPGAPVPGGYDVASVILDANATRIYGTALTMLRKHPEVQIVQQDPAHNRVEFAQGPVYATLTVVPLSNTLSQLLVASNTAPGPASATSRVVEGVMNVCREMKKRCTLTQ